jgi:hypothetical protein
MGWLNNSWMNNPNYLAQVGHVLFAYSLILTLGFYSGHLACYIALGVGIPIAALKEFWYDADYELPKQTAWDNILDFSMYVVGAGLGMAAVFLHK